MRSSRGRAEAGVGGWCRSRRGLRIRGSRDRSRSPSASERSIARRRPSAPGRRGGRGFARPATARACHASKVVGIGEAGLDYYYDYGSREAQKRDFRAHIGRRARITGLPLVIHTRDADDESRRSQEEMAKGAFDAVLHCFTGGRELATEAIALGCRFSFSGLLTFKNSRGAARHRARRAGRPLLVETDSPFLAPASIPRQTQRAGLRRRDGQVLATCSRASTRRRSPPRRAKTSSACSPRVPRPERRRTNACADHPGLRLVRRRAARRASGWGTCDPANPKNRRRRCSVLVERGRRAAAMTQSCSSTPRPTCATS